MKINLDIGDFIRRNLPIHMIQKNRLDLYWMVMRELDTIWKDYASFRDIKDIERNITFSKQSLEWWLNYQIFGGGNKLSIIFGGGNPYFVVLENRDTGDTDYIELSLESDGLENVELARKSDSFGTITTDFAVESQVSLTDIQKEDINLIVEQYRTAGTDYQIIIA